MGNLFEGIPSDLPEELIETLVESEHVRIERIVSRGHTSPKGFWYEQDEDEFVLVVSGEGEIEFEDGEKVRMKVGDWVNILAGVRHRVSWTSDEVDTVWVGVFSKHA